MKKYFLCLLALLMLCLAGCKDPDYGVDTFYTTEMLTEYSLADLPAPKLENSRIYEENLYCNLTQEEYEAYVAQVIAYFQGREDVRHLCYLYDSTLMFGVFPHRTYTLVTEDYDLSGSHSFSYLTTELDEEGSPKTGISISRTSDTLGKTGFFYNTHIRIDKSISGDVDPCAAKHTNDQGTVYPVPGMDLQVTVFTCIYCGYEGRDSYPDFGDYQQYAVTVSEGKNYIFGNNWSYLPWDISSMYPGGIIEITTSIHEEGPMEILVNGEVIPLLRTEGDKQTFGFIMPNTDVDIRLRIVTEDAAE